MTKSTKPGKRSSRPAKKRAKREPNAPKSLAKLPRSPVRQKLYDILAEMAAGHYATFVPAAPDDPEPIGTFEFKNELNLARIPQAAWDAFLEDLRETGNVTYSCRRIGIKRVTVYKHAKANADFKKDMQEAHQMGLSHLEDVAVQRATKGVSRPVFYRGEIVGFTQEYSDQLLQFLLSGNHPKYKKYKDEEEVHDTGGVMVVPAPVSNSDWEVTALSMQKKLRDEVRD